MAVNDIQFLRMEALLSSPMIISFELETHSLPTFIVISEENVLEEIRYEIHPVSTL